jgi:hypothetical protein
LQFVYSLFFGPASLVVRPDSSQISLFDVYGIFTILDLLEFAFCDGQPCSHLFASCYL